MTSPGRDLPWSVAALRARDAHPALVADGERLTYGELAERVEAASHRLGPTRRLVAIEAATAVEPLVTLLACLAEGHPVLLVAPDGSSGRALADRYDVDVLVGADGALQERRAGTAHQLHPDLALLLSTSGTTGSPKLVRLSAENLTSNAAAIAEYLALGEHDRAITTLPLHYCYGLSVLTSHVHAGGSLVLSTASVVDPCFRAAVVEHEPTGFAGVPHTFELLERADPAVWSAPSLRYLTQAGGRLAPEAVQRWARRGAQHGVQLFVMYGQTEATARMAYLPPGQAARRPTSIGRAIPGGSFALDHGVPAATELGPDVGELLYRGPNVMLGYAESPADLASGRTVDVLRTGDLARRGDDGLYEVVGRANRFLKLFGLRVDLGRVERHLADRGVEAVATGDDERLVLAVRGDHGLAEHAATSTAAELGLPSRVVVALAYEELPRLPSGKPDLPAVRARAAAEQAPSQGGAPTPGGVGADAQDVRGVLARNLGLAGPEQVHGDDTFVGLGGDSLSYVEVSIGLERVLGPLPPDWHVRPVARLEAGARAPTRWARLDTTVVVRAVAIVLVVARHVGTWSWAGGAHLLLVVSGWNLARFQLAPQRTHAPVRGVLSAALKVAVPSVVWLTLVSLLTDHYGWTNALLVHDLLGVGGDARWRYWYVEAIVQLLLLVALVLLVPGADRLDRRHPAVLPGALLATALVVRAGVVDLDGLHPYGAHVTRVLACFALGWLAQRAGHVPARLAVSALAVLVVPPLFPNPERDLLVTGGVLVLLWIPVVAVPRLVAAVLGALAGGSLYVYLTHWQVFPLLDGVLPPGLVVVVTLAVGVLVWHLVELATQLVVLRRARRRGPPSPSAATARSEQLVDV